MPFIARDAETHERIDITRLQNPRVQLQAARLICQLCETRMIVRQGLLVRAHFAHTQVCPLAYSAHPESPEHLLGKERVSQWLAKQADFRGARIELEVPIHARKRIADILVTFPQGHQLAVEIQLASITTGELEARTKDYLDDGIDVIWVLGKTAAASPSNKDWCRELLGGFLTLTFTEHHEALEIALIDESPTVNGPTR